MTKDYQLVYQHVVFLGIPPFDSEHLKTGLKLVPMTQDIKRTQYSYPVLKEILGWLSSVYDRERTDGKSLSNLYETD